ncbi:ER degradation-enhancing alpha-mannosidase-like protein 1 [Psilocybe cubensis]|uniref:ER degradation-enhancing alpha-mannosidase-like protein 1 n=2 Tax=Psilocybe cubensis TaxID=181762 RepID=A0ACB8H5D2_PSICU|nr:ER degradation-enhancing alpha-mannosidase-like protein 1 [Psilocybe cubensis]KAH9482917.1 ER degradation-enhancing alpha-mannosidase-like protein 1 [Psilocybe cubensis]
MKWGSYWPEVLIVVGLLAFNGSRWFHATDASSPLKVSSGWTSQRKLAAREKTRELWYHGFDNYMTFAFPLDELTPLSCSGQGPDWTNVGNYAANDVAGNFSLTLVDVLDTLVVLDDRTGFEKAVKNVIEWVSFDVNTKPQVFETTIRVLGGLLSAHIFANQTGQPFHLPWYRGELLSLAHDLGKRLLPAFSTPTGLPYARINLRHGIAKGESVETCTAGAGSLILEFATLSRLTGDDRFEKAAYRAFFGIWNRKSDIDLVGNTINTWTGAWTHPETTGIGAGMDSFYEYALKWYIMSGEIEFLDVWDDAYAALMRFSRTKDGHSYRTVNMHSGDAAYNTIDSLSAFWPGLQVLAGDVQNAIKLHMIYYNLWRQHAGLPEVYDTNYKQATSHSYPLRPEFIESTWYLYRATRDPFYLDVGERVLFDLTTRAKVQCGLAGISDLRTNKRDDRMESFALSETLKYLYLLFDEDNPLHSDDSNYVFTTEGHILTLGQQHMKPASSARKRTRKIVNHQCPIYTPFVTTLDHRRKPPGPGLVQGIRSRPDVDYARQLVGLAPSHADQQYWSPDGWCERPKVDPYTYEFILAAPGQNVQEDLSPSLLKLGVQPDGYIIHNVSGIRTQIVQRLDGQGYDIKKLGHYSVRPGQLVYINDSTIFPSGGDSIAQDELHRREPEVNFRLFTVQTDPTAPLPISLLNKGNIDISVPGYTAKFGADLSSYVVFDSVDAVPRIRTAEGVPILRDPENTHGCDPYDRPYPHSMLIVRRGECTFLEKAVHARDAGAAGVIIISNEEGAINPTANIDELEDAGDLSSVAVVLLPKKAGDAFEDLLILTESMQSTQIMMALQHQLNSESGDLGYIPIEEEEHPKDPNRILYINGHPLINTRLLV